MIILNIPQTWTFVSYVRDSVSEYLTDSISSEIRDAAVLVASELTENTIKFGCAPPEEDADATENHAKINIQKSDDNIIIASTTSASLANIKRLKEILDDLQNADNTEVLYLNRLQEIMENPSQTSSRLGLIRIVHEANFTLTYEIEGTIVTVIATRQLTP